MPICVQTVQQISNLFKKKNWLKCIQAFNALFQDRLRQDELFLPYHTAYFYVKSQKLHEIQIGLLNKFPNKGTSNMGTKYL